MPGPLDEPLDEHGPVPEGPERLGGGPLEGGRHLTHLAHHSHTATTTAIGCLQIPPNHYFLTLVSHYRSKDPFPASIQNPETPDQVKTAPSIISKKKI